MITVEFQAKVENGVIVVPQEYQQFAEGSTVTSLLYETLRERSEVKSQKSKVKIIVLKQPKMQTMQFDIMDELAQNPVAVPGIRSITREEMHSG